MITEADEAATSKAQALANLREQVIKGETMGVIDMYERAALTAGATYDEVEAVVFQASLAKQRLEAMR